jgi:serpin B
MKLQTTLSFSTVLLALATAAPANQAPAATDPGALAAGNQQFAVDLYQQVRQQPGNLVFSPYSISTALAMTYAGARGQTATEMAVTLHFPGAQAELPAGFAALAKQLNAAQQASGAEFVLANSLWCQRDFPLSDSFLQVARRDYLARVESVDFVNHPGAAARDINTWVEQQTRDRIKDLIPPSAITPLTRLILANAIYFKGRWQTQFNPKATQPGPFHLTADRAVTVPLMQQKARARLAQLDGVKLLELPYRGEKMSMVLVLPDQPQGLSAVETRLTSARLRDWLAALDTARPGEVEVTLPRFKSTASLSLSQILARMGMPTAFDQRAADFSGLTGRPDLHISEVVHKAFVEVNEEGTEAAAATGVIMATRAMLTREFRADQPFLYLIRDQTTGSILFMGRLTDPNA